MSHPSGEAVLSVDEGDEADSPLMNGNGTANGEAVKVEDPEEKDLIRSARNFGRSSQLITYLQAIRRLQYCR